jgi:glycosyltransferase involved in cell wall biosynthesis
MARGDAVIANSAYTASRITRVHAPDAARVFTVPRGIDVDRFNVDSVATARVDQLRARWGIMPDGRTLFMLPARLTRWKGQGLAVEAAALLQKNETLRGTFSLLLVGDAQGRDAYVHELEQMIARGGLEDCVALTGPCDDMPAAYALADCVLSPSIEAEPFGRTAVEAQAMQCPVIASDSGGQRETVVSDGASATGFAVTTNDAPALARAMEAVLALSLEERIAMGARGRANVMAHYSLAAMTAATLDIYARLLTPAHV